MKMDMSLYNEYMKELSKTYNSLNKELKKKLYRDIIKGYDDKIKVCMWCKSRLIKKNGRLDGLQRFLCMKCNKTFGTTKLEPQKWWNKYLNLLSKGKTIEEVLKEIPISNQYIFRWNKTLEKKIDKFSKGEEK